MAMNRAGALEKTSRTMWPLYPFSIVYVCSIDVFASDHARSATAQTLSATKGGCVSQPTNNALVE
jgi:hypothetical protein